MDWKLIKIKLMYWFIGVVIGGVCGSTISWARQIDVSTAANINALPDGIRKYVHELETLCDPAGIVQENILLKDAMRALEIKIVEQKERGT